MKEQEQGFQPIMKIVQHFRKMQKQICDERK